MSIKILPGRLYLKDYCTFTYESNETRQKKNKNYISTCRMREFFWNFIIDKDLKNLKIPRILYGIPYHVGRIQTLEGVAWKKTITIFKEDIADQEESLEFMSYKKMIADGERNDLEEVYDALTGHEKMRLHEYFSIQQDVQ